MLATSSWRLSDSVSLRPEPFGALAYDFHTRRLSFLKTPELVEVVRGLGESRDVASALTAAGVADGDHPAYLIALARLAASGLIEERAR
jgi:putative mycofactocin binding protein MftB